MTEQYSRRRFLAGASLTGAGLLAGCLGDSNSGETEASETATTTEALPDVVTEIGFDGMDLVVGLQPDAAVSKLNLISPDGTAFASKSVTRGATTVRIPILDADTGFNEPKHYTPGLHELVVITEESAERIPVSLEPDIQLVNVRVNSDATNIEDRGKLEFTVENVGTGPTWVFDITYEDAPNSRANIPLNEYPGFARFEWPNETRDFVVGPAEQRSFVDDLNPLRFPGQEYSGCDLGTFEIRAKIGVANGDLIEADIKSEIGGAEINRNMYAKYGCDESVVEVIAIRRSKWEN
ncbi:hypothetical protein [Haloarchaeobius sp. DYHT-AS-18]|uniref:hypothetical protein n=1 Tax=Haloarchaeobius sp. DYHT-AS-18 TaxID=3446117 RepID=UPI003EB91766